MLKLDILVPIVLILCLIALAYILSEVFKTSGETEPEQTEIVLDPTRYTDEGSSSTPANISNTPAAVTDNEVPTSAGTTTDNTTPPVTTTDDNFQEPAADENAGTPSFSDTPVRQPATTSNTISSASSGAASSAAIGERYMVIAGSFRQKIYAQQRVRELKKSGFNSARIGYTNRGAYAVALVDDFNRLSDAQILANRVKGKGYDAFIKQR